MDIESARLPTATEILMDTQTELKMLVKACVTNVYAMFGFNNKAMAIINKNLKFIENETLKQTAYISLMRFAQELYLKMVQTLQLGQIAVVFAFTNTQAKGIDTKILQKELAKRYMEIPKGTLNNAFSQLGNSQSKVSRSQSLYGHSELMARFEEQQQMLDKLKQQTNLVICDTHSDCSDRCFRWQGRVYSLDGTSGVTDDGRQYVPLEVATGAKDKYGHTNGLLGYNCRHKLMPYKSGVRPARVSKQEQQKQQKLTSTQRELERKVRNAKDMALSFQGVDNDKYNEWNMKAKLYNKQYVDFCHDNNRVEYRSRIQI